MAIELFKTRRPVVPGYGGHAPQYEYYDYIPYGSQAHMLTCLPVEPTCCQNEVTEEAEKEKKKLEEEEEAFKEYEKCVLQQLESCWHVTKDMLLRTKEEALKDNEPKIYGTAVLGPTTIYRPDMPIQDGYAGHVPKRGVLGSGRIVYGMNSNKIEE